MVFIKNLSILLILSIIISCSKKEEVIPELTLTVTVTPTDGGTIQISPEKETYNPTDKVTLTPQPNEYYEFVGWSGDVEGTSR